MERGDEPFSVVILAGGRSTRLGADKAALRLGGETLVARVSRRLASLTDDLIGVGRVGQPAPPALAGRWVHDAVRTPVCRRHCWRVWPRRAIPGCF